METKKIYVVSSFGFGGYYSDKWENIECAFETKEAADAYMLEQEELGNKIDDDFFDEIKDCLAEKEYEIQCKYYDPNTTHLYKDANEEDYHAESEEFNNVTKYKIIKEKFNVNKDEYDKKVNNISSGFVGYIIREIDLYS